MCTGLRLVVTGITCRTAYQEALNGGGDTSTEKAAFDSDCAGLGGTPCVLSGYYDDDGENLKEYWPLCLPVPGCSSDDLSAMIDYSASGKCVRQVPEWMECEFGRWWRRIVDR